MTNPECPSPALTHSSQASSGAQTFGLQARRCTPNPSSSDGVEVESGAAPRWSVIWLHGLGADGHDFEPIVPALLRADWPAIRFVFPHASVRPVTLNGGMRMRAWYDLASLEIGQTQDSRGIHDSITRLHQLIAREAARGIPVRQIVVAGFSQGGAIALSGAIRFPQQLAGLIALSTYLPLAVESLREASPANREIPIFMAHGSADPILPQALGEGSRDRLRAAGYVVDWRSYRMPHGVVPDEIAAISEWLTERFLS